MRRGGSRIYRPGLILSSWPPWILLPEIPCPGCVADDPIAHATRERIGGGAEQEERIARTSPSLMGSIPDSAAGEIESHPHMVAATEAITSSNSMLRLSFSLQASSHGPFACDCSDEGPEDTPEASEHRKADQGPNQQQESQADEGEDLLPEARDCDAGCDHHSQKPPPPAAPDAHLGPLGLELFIAVVKCCELAIGQQTEEITPEDCIDLRGRQLANAMALHQRQQAISKRASLLQPASPRGGGPQGCAASAAAGPWACHRDPQRGH